MTIEYDRNGSGFPIPEQNEPSEASSGDAAAKTGKPAKRSDGKGRKSNKGARKAAKTKTSRTVRDASQGGAKSGQPADVSGDFADLLALLEDRAGAGKGSGKMARRGAETGLLWTLSALALAACGGGGGGGGPTVKAPPTTGGNTNTGGGPVFGGTLQSKLAPQGGSAFQFGPHDAGLKTTPLTKAASNPGNRFWVKLASISGSSGSLTLEATAAATAMGIVIANEAASLTSATGLDSGTHIGVDTNNNIYFKGNIVIGNGHASGDQLTDIENIYGSAHNDVLTGNAAQNVLEGGAGADDLDGGAGVDTASYAGSTAAVTVTVNATSGNTGGDAAGDKLYNIENLVGSDGDDTLTGDGEDNIIYGGKGADTIKGMGGRDTLYGNEGDDELTGGAGVDTIYGGTGTDTVFYTGATAHATGYTMSGVTYTGVIVNLGSGLVKGADAETTDGGVTVFERLYDVENVTGSGHDDHITGDAGANQLTARRAMIGWMARAAMTSSMAGPMLIC
jgi:Ca2+-binding RTX toxin-like protein